MKQLLRKGISSLLIVAMVFTTVFSNLVVTASAADIQSYNWDFSTSNFESGTINITNASVPNTGTITSTDDTSQELNIDASGNSNAKFYTSGNNYLQVGEGSKIEIPTIGEIGATNKITIVTYVGTTTFTLNGDAVEADSSGLSNVSRIKEVTVDEDKHAELIITSKSGNDYIKSITVSTVAEPVGDPKTMEAGKSYNFDFKTIDTTRFPNQNQEIFDKLGAEELLFSSIVSEGTLNGEFLKIIKEAGCSFQSHSVGTQLKNVSFEFVVPGNATISLVRHTSSAEGTITATADSGNIKAINPDSGSDFNTQPAGDTNASYTYEGGKAKIKLTFTSEGSVYLPSITVENEAAAGAGESFEYWLDGGNAATDVKSAAETIATNTGIDQGGNTVKIYTDMTRYDSATLTVDGTQHVGYRATNNRIDESNKGKKGNGTTSSEPTQGTAIGFTAANNGMLTVYFCPETINKFEVFKGQDGSFPQSTVSVQNNKYTLKVSNGTTYFFQTQATDNFAPIGMKFVADKKKSVNVTVNNTNSEKAEVEVGNTLTLKDTDLGESIDPIDIYTVLDNGANTTGTTSVDLYEGHTYSVSSSNPAVGASFDGNKAELKVDAETSELTINLVKVPDTTLIGTITKEDGIAPEISELVNKIQFQSKTNEAYTVDAVVEGDSYNVAAIKPGEYTTKVTFKGEYGNTYAVSDNVSVKAEGGNVDEVYIYNPNKTVTPNFNKSIKVGKTGADYTTVKEALAAIKAAGEPKSEAERVTITLTSDIEEQVVIDVPYITIDGQNAYTISWYYALPGGYYSVEKSTGLYNEVLFRDKYNKNGVVTTYWGGVVIVDASDFYAKDVTFKNSFNYEVTEKEKADGAEIFYDPGHDNNSTKLPKGTIIDDNSPIANYTWKERANALALTANSDRAEFYNVKVLSSQDTLGLNGNEHKARAYFKNCTIGGNVDYICGGGNMIFDDCTLETYNYTDSNAASGGYITAAKNSNYLFRNCEVTMHNTEGATINKTTIYYGRPWGASANVKFVNTKTNGWVNQGGWTNWNETQTAKDANFGEYGNADKEGNAFYSGLADSDKDTKMSTTDYNTLVENITKAGAGYLGDDWTPKHFAAPIAENVESSSDTVNAVKVQAEGANGSANAILLYGEVANGSLDKASTIGFEVGGSDAGVLVGNDTYTFTRNEVYNGIKFTDADGKSKEIKGSGDKLLFACLLTGLNNSMDSKTLRIRTVQETNGDKVYGKIVEKTISSIEKTAGEAATE